MRMSVSSCVAILLVTVFSMLTAGSAFAQTGEGGLISVPAEKQAISPGGVDLRTGRYSYDETDLSIGDEAGGLALKRAFPTAVPRVTNLPFGNFSSNWNILFQIFRVSLSQRDAKGGFPPGNDYLAFINYGGSTTTFAGRGGGYGQESRDEAAYLKFTGTQGTADVVYTFTRADGTSITFRPLGSIDGMLVSGIYATQVVKADGSTIMLDYAPYSSGSINLARLRSVTSNRGYAILLEGSGALVSKACTINLAEAVLPANQLCPASAPASTAYNYSGNNLSSVTDTAMGVWQFIYGGSAESPTIGFVKPGQSVPWLTNTLFQTADGMGDYYDAVRSQAFADGQSYSYAYRAPPAKSDSSGQIAGGHYTNGQNASVSVTYGFPRMPNTGPGSQCTHFPCSPPQIDTMLYQQTSGPVSIIDTLGHATVMDYCAPEIASGCLVSLLQSFTDSEGIKTTLTYDNFSNVTQARKAAKPGSGLADIVISATYDCTYRINCAKPVTKTDGRLNTTSYTYDANHGGVLTETGPAVGGVQPVKRHAYAQFYAWLKTTGGGHAPAATPVWLPTEERTCKTTATVGSACAGGAADEVVVSYGYQVGNASTPSNLLLRGKVVTAGGASLRTCYGYDNKGNQIWERSPRAGLTNCQ
jgi:hypothetical protein